MTLTERRILANQYRILAALTKDKRERQHYEEQIEILQDGYEIMRVRFSGASPAA